MTNDYYEPKPFESYIEEVKPRGWDDRQWIRHRTKELKQLADVLDGGRGYEALCVMRDRLEEHRETVEERIYERIAELALAVYGISEEPGMDQIATHGDVLNEMRDGVAEDPADRIDANGTIYRLIYTMARLTARLHLLQNVLYRFEVFGEVIGPEEAPADADEAIWLQTPQGTANATIDQKRSIVAKYEQRVEEHPGKKKSDIAFEVLKWAGDTHNIYYSLENPGATMRKLKANVKSAHG
ncbi:MAG: hypothetical protein GVY12_01460 [Bacteroidetes bacterium]|jgi:hypothetical protein|nr:hypothetical protein [Bacteroidota bacterium]